MKGEIYIKATPEKEGTPLTVHCVLENVNGMDKYNIIDSITDSLHMTDEDIMGYFIYRKIKRIGLDD